MDSQKRRHKRYHVEGIHGNMLFASEVNILNLSLGGAAIEADKRLNIGREYTLKLEHKGKTISVRGLVVWSVISRNKRTEQGESIPIYQAGLQFIDVLNEKSKELLDFLNSRKVVDESRVSGIRFVIDSDQTAVLNYPFSYRVKSISLSGLLIETDHEFRQDDRFNMEIFLEENVPVSFSGRVVTCRDSEEEENRLYEVGIEFVEMSEESRASLKQYLSSL
jgi:c-di-GMP-binding flagellar brake protein YcgR